VQANLDCLKKDVILLVDTFFSVLIWKGRNIKEWESAGYHLQEEYAHLKNLLEMPYEDRS
jgi:protein transport protein SEC23